MGTGEQYTSGAAVGNGVYKTIDGGLNWTSISVDYIVGDLSKDIISVLAGVFYINDIIAWDTNGSTEIFLGVGAGGYADAGPLNWLGLDTAGLYKSTDGGASWTRDEAANMAYYLELGETSYPLYYIPNDFKIGADNSLWMGTISTFGVSYEGGGRIFHSTDGISWTQKTLLANSNRVELAVSSSNKDKLYALTEGTDNVPHIYATTNAFTSVLELAKPIDVDEGIPEDDFARYQDFYNLMIEVDPTDDAILYVGGIDLFRTTQGTDADESSDWQQISKWSNNNLLDDLTCSLVHADQHAMVFRPGDSNQAVFGNDGGVYFTTSLSTAATSDVFGARNVNYNVTQFYYGGYGQDLAYEIAVAGAQDNGTQFIEFNSSTVNPGTIALGGDGAFCAIDKEGEYMVVSYVHNNYAYLEIPYTGYGYHINEDEHNEEGDFINQAALDSNKDILFANGSIYDEAIRINRYMLGTDTAEKKVLTNELLTGWPTAFKVSPFTTKSTTLLVGTENGKLLKISKANELNTSLICWEDMNGPFTFGDDGFFIGSISDIEFGNSEDEIIVTLHNYNVTNIWMTTNAGVSWSSKEGDLPDFPVKCILPNPLAENEAIIGTDLGVWTTSNFQEPNPNWTRSHNGMRDVKVVDLDRRETDNSVLATTFGRGLFTGDFRAETESNAYFIVPNNSIVSTCGNEAVFNFSVIGDYSNLTNLFIGFPESLSGKVSGSFNFSAFPDCSLTISGIQDNSVALGAHFFRIYAYEQSTERMYTDFVIQVQEPVGMFSSLEPADNEITPPGVFSFEWDIVEGATSYTIEISESAQFSTLFDTATTFNNFYTNENDFVVDTQYYWRVLAENHCDATYCPTKTFRTSSLLGSEQLNDINGKMVVYPTISSGVFYISATANFGNTHIEVFTSSGNSVYQDTVFLNGTTKLFIDLSHLSTGLYRMKCRSNSGTEIIEVIIK